MSRALALAAAAFALASCTPKPDSIPDDAPPNAHSLVRLPCHAVTPRPANPSFCAGRNYVTPVARSVIEDAAAAMSRRYPGFVFYYMDASGPDAKRPFAPHLSHGDGREIDVALVYDGADGRPLARPPTASGYYGYVNPRPGDLRPCHGINLQRAPDLALPHSWRLDEARTRDLVLTIVGDPRVKRIFLEPHLKLRLGLSAEAKVHFQGCWAARHDDHIHVDVD